MKAAVHTRYGAPEVVQVIDIDRPTPDAGELLVRVHATTVNRTDCATRAAKPFFARLMTGLTKPKSTVLGCEFAGVVEEVGDDVDAFGAGDRVFGYNEGPFGAHAEFLVISAEGAVAIIPSNTSFDAVVAATEGSHYALMMITKSEVQAGQRVLVNGATGAIGSAAVQILRTIGAEVTAVCATDQMALVEELGADRVIDYTAEDFTDDHQTYDVVFDTVGKGSFGRCRRLLQPRGLYFSSELGRFAQNPILAILSPLFRGRRVVFPIPYHDQKMVRYFAEMIENGEFKPVIDRRYPLDQIVDAYHYVETGHKIGNVVITIGGAERFQKPR